jgi:hypothetical protein
MASPKLEEVVSVYVEHEAHALNRGGRMDTISAEGDRYLFRLKSNELQN